MITKIEGTCQYEGCELVATQIAGGRYRYTSSEKGHEVGCYCEMHAVVVADEGNPEYHTNCPNCNCLFGVN